MKLITPVALCLITPALCLCLADCAHGGPDALSPAAYHQKLTTADALYARKAFAEALPIYTELAEQDPRNGRLALRINHCLLRLNRLDEAVEAGKNMLRLGHGNRPRTSIAIARWHARRGEVDQAFHWLERALSERFQNRSGIQRDSGFASLRDDPRYREVAGLPPSRELTREEGWRLDLEFFAAEVARLHGDPERFGSSTEFRAMVRDLQSRLASLSNEQIAFEIQKLAVSLGDGHTVVYPMPTERVRFSQLPIKLYLFSDGLFIVGGKGDGAALVGREVKAIGVKGIPTLMEDLKAIVHRDNDIGISWLGPRFLIIPEALRALGAIDDPDEVPLTLVDRGGNAERVILRGGPGGRPTKLGPPVGAAGDVPLYLRDVGNHHWIEPLPDLDAVYVQFNQVRDKPDQTLEQFTNSLKQAIDRDKPKNLIVDLRLNNGGKGSGWRSSTGAWRIWPMVRPLVYFEMLAEGNRLYIVTGRNTFSAAQSFLNHVEAVTNAVIVGEPSSSKPNSVGGETIVVLPWSGLQMCISRRFWQDSFPDDQRPWIPPHIPVTLSSEDYFANHDPVMAALEEVIRGGVRR